MSDGGGGLTALPIVVGAAAARDTVFRKRVVDEGGLSDAERGLIAKLYPSMESATADAAVRRIIDEVRSEGDAALRRISAALDGFAPDPIRVSEAEFAAARAAVDPGLIGALQAAAERVRDYHERQLAHAVQSFEHDGIGQIVRPIARVGLYVPGTAVVYPSSVLHTAIPAVVAGVEDVCIASPVSAAAGGSVAAIKLVAAEIAGVTSVYKVGGAQAIAALAYGTESVPAVDKIFGPGNRFVTLAKRMVYGDVGIDALYGPTETIVVTDDSADPELCAADLLAQAEHDTIAAPILITSSERVARAVAAIVPRQAAALPRGDVALQAFENRGASSWPRTCRPRSSWPTSTPRSTWRSSSPTSRRRWIGCATRGGCSSASPRRRRWPTTSPGRRSHADRRQRALRVAAARGRLPQGHERAARGRGTAGAVADDAITIAHAEGLQAHARSLDVRRSDR